MKPTVEHCIFCPSTNLSREHLWPKWAGAVLRPEGYKGKRSEKYIVKTKKTQTVLERTKNRHGHTTDKHLRVVCDACNNRWMSQLEDNVKSIALPLILGDIFDLTPEMQETLAMYIVSKEEATEIAWSLGMLMKHPNVVWSAGQ